LAEKHKLEKLLFESRKEKELFDSKMQFYTSVTHEIKTPLTLIKAPLEKIIDSGDGNEETKSNLRIIEKNTKRLLDLCMELLDFRKVESGGIKLNLENTDIVMWVKTILQSFYPTFEKERKKIKEIIPTSRFEAEVDRNSFSKIIGNMLSNAVKYSDSYISIEITEPNGANFSIIVRNDGDLIPEQSTDDIFNPFYRANGAEKREGNGIGLSLSRTLSELHGGSISYSQEDGLNKFVLTLPLHKDKKKEISESNKNETSVIVPPNSEDITILVAEDQDDLREFVANELKCKYKVLEASDGKEALRIIENNTVNIIVSDVMMPEMDGFELCDEIKNNVSTSHIPIILLTAQYNEQYRLKGLNTGADAYMEKPFSIELLKAQIGNLLKSRRLLGQMYIEKPQMAMDALSVSKVDNIFLKKFQDYLDTHISDENLSIEKLAEAMNLSETTLYRKVKSISGLSPKEFVRVTRLKRAIILMSEGETRINEIAYQVGFGSASYFSTCFQKQYGKSPTEYIKNKLPNGDVV
jgi:DNA-binding response OmpR family regulator